MLRCYHRIVLGTLLVVLFAVPPAWGQPCTPDLDADVNGDCIVDPLDGGFVLARFGCPVGTGDPGCDTADTNGDGLVDPLDVGFILARFCGGGTLPTVDVDQPQSPTNSTLVTLTGQTVAALTVEIVGGVEVVVVPVDDCTFSAEVELHPNSVNDLFLTGISGDGVEGAPVPVTIIHDAQPPSLFIDFPTDGAELTTETTDVAGRVSDLLSGFLGLDVTVNGLEAVVDIGIGTNGTFFLAALPLALGDNTITAVATDLLGNETVTEITVTRVEIPKDSPQMVAISGNGQIAQINTMLPEPVVIQVTHGDGTPFENKVVTFDVTQSNGRLTEDGAGEGSLMLQVHTDAAGLATAHWTLGTDAGCGNNRIEVTSNSIAGTIFFCASATPAPAAQINVGSGNNQRAEINAPAPEPLRVWVSDACNGVADIPVTFTVTRGSGTVNGQDSVTVNTTATGHAEVEYFVGAGPGNQAVEADFPNNPSGLATFSIFGIERDETLPTSFAGLVLNNASQPIEGATVTLTVVGEDSQQTLTSPDGQFNFDDVPGSGQADLIVDGLTATAVGGVPIEPGSFPVLHFMPIVVPNAANSLSSPILLPSLDPANAVVYDGSQTEDLELTTIGMDGLKMILRAGTTVTLADGTKIGPNDPGTVTLSLNQVHSDDVPMPMPDGAAPPFAWTLQPAGAAFDIPVEIVYPNMSGLPAGSVSYFLSFNHATNAFEIIGSGTVSDDGSTITSDPGVGITTSGWGCNCPPYSVTGECCSSAAGGIQEGDSCRECKGGELANRPDGTPCDDLDPCTDNDECSGGICEGDPIGTACGSESISVDYSNWPETMGTRNRTTINAFSFTGDVCTDSSQRVWRYQPQTLSADGILEYCIGCNSPEPVTGSGGNVGDCPPQNPGEACWCDIVAGLECVVPAGDSAGWATLAGNLDHEQYHKTVDWPGWVDAEWEVAQAEIAILKVNCEVSESNANSSLAALAKVSFLRMQVRIASSVKAFVQEHNACPKDDGAYQAEIPEANAAVSVVTSYAQAQGFATCPTPPSCACLSFGPPLSGIEITVTPTILDPGDTAVVTVFAIYGDETKIDITFDEELVLYSADSSIAEVTEARTVLAVNSGDTLIVASLGDHIPFTAPAIVGVTSADDLDHDYVPDLYEEANGMDPSDGADAELDFDGDGLSNLEEYLLLTDPQLADTDGDGLNDGEEILQGLDPLNPPHIDDGWTLSVNGQAVTANSDGTFFVANVSAADVFGDVPGTPPDFLSDDFVQMTGEAAVGGKTYYAFTAPFQIAQGETFVVEELTITDIPPPLPASIEAIANPSVVELDETTQLVVTATMGDGTQQDVTPRSTWTTYRTSNTQVASVGQDGLVTATGLGTAYITATNGGATSVERIDVVSETVSTTVEGFVQDEKGVPVDGAEVTSNFGGMATTDAVGFFALPLVAPADSNISVTVTVTIDDQGFVGSAGPFPIVPDGFVDAGIISLQPAASGPLFPGMQLPVGDFPDSVTAADLDGDGDLDLATANLFSDNVSVLLNNGDGTFTEHVLYGTGNGPRSITAADLDGDGDLDLATANYFSDDVSVLLNNGDGTFAADVLYEAGDSPYSVTSADLDGDGDLDLAVANYNSDNVSVLLNNGDGTFAADVLYGAGNGPYSVTAADLDGDGDLDLTTANVSSDNVSVLLNNGDGTFAAEVLYGAGDTPYSITAADLDGDGDLDLATANFNSDNVSVLLNNGDGTFAADVLYGAGDAPWSLTAADLDGDGDIDLGVANWLSDNVSVLLNNGDGTFAADVLYEAGDSPYSVTAADLDGDGDLDLATANIGSDDVSVLLNNGDGTFAEHVLYGAGNGPYSVTAADLDGDGDIDLATAHYLSDNVSVLLNNGDGTFAANVFYGAGDYPVSVIAADLDGDGDLDLATANLFSDNVSVLLNNGDGTFAADALYGAGDAPYSVTAADLDGDGDLDLATANYNSDNVSVLLNNGDGTFAADVLYAVGDAPYSVTTADLDGDGDLDLATANSASDNVSVLLNNGDGTFAADVIYGVGDFPRSVTAADLDGDGDLDLATANYSSDNVSVLLNNGDGTFAAEVLYGAGDAPYSVTAADLDGDGDLDLATANAGGDNVSILFNRRIP